MNKWNRENGGGASYKLKRGPLWLFCLWHDRLGAFRVRVDEEWAEENFDNLEDAKKAVIALAKKKVAEMAAELEAVR